MKKAIIAPLFLLLSLTTHSIEKVSCTEIAEYIDNNQSKIFNIHMFNSNVALLSQMTNVGFNFTDFSLGEGKLERISKDRFRQTTTVEGIKTIREFSLTDTKEGCYFDDMYLPQHNETQKPYLTTIYEGGLVLGLGDGGERLLQPNE